LTCVIKRFASDLSSLTSRPGLKIFRCRCRRDASDRLDREKAKNRIRKRYGKFADVRKEAHL
jgi:hypothetical protein